MNRRDFLRDIAAGLCATVLPSGIIMPVRKIEPVYSTGISREELEHLFRAMLYGSSWLEVSYDQERLISSRIDTLPYTQQYLEG